jgi:hypothetical protein
MSVKKKNQIGDVCQKKKESGGVKILNSNYIILQVAGT